MNIYDMKLNEGRMLSEGLFITRVPGGWIYNFHVDDKFGRHDSPVFVPHNDEFGGVGVVPPMPAPDAFKRKGI